MADESVRTQTVPVPGQEFDSTDEAQFRRMVELFMQNTQGRISRIAADIGGGGNMVPLPGRWWTAGIIANDASANSTLNDENRMWLLPILPVRACTITDLAIDVETLDDPSNARIGIYESNADTGVPTFLMDSTGDLDCSTAGVKSDTLGTVISLEGGVLYWVATALKGGTPAIWADGALVGMQLGKATATRTGAEVSCAYVDIGAWISLPASAGAVDGYITSRPFVAMKIG